MHSKVFFNRLGTLINGFGGDLQYFKTKGLL